MQRLHIEQGAAAISLALPGTRQHLLRLQALWEERVHPTALSPPQKGESEGKGEKTISTSTQQFIADQRLHET
jgi:hypothetical protein